MDPTQTWKDLWGAIEAQDHESAREHAENLLEWLEKGGFPPEITKLDLHTLLVYLLRKLLKKD